MSKIRSSRELLLKPIAEDFKSKDIMPYLTRAFEVGYDEGYKSYGKGVATTDLEKIPDWILIRDLSRKVQDLERELDATRKELDATRKELEDSKVVNGEKLHKASIEIQREKMYNKQEKELIKWRRQAHELARTVASLKVELNRMKGIV